MSRFPLEVTSQHQLYQLCETLWSWTLCDDCSELCRQQNDGCSSRRLMRLTRFFEYYKSLTTSYEPEVGIGEVAALNRHEDLFALIRFLKANPDLTRAQLAEIAYPNVSNQRIASAVEQERAITLAVQTMIMVNCSPWGQSTALLESGSHRTPWRSGIPFSQFVSDIFPTSDFPDLNDDETGLSHNMRTSLLARKLKEVVGMEFRPTDDLRNHLKLDRRNNVVEIYHHTAFLKEHLRLTKDRPDCVTLSDSLKIGALPRQLVLETLDSIQKVLFPWDDPKSRSLLKSLISKSSFDPDCIRREFAALRTVDEKEISFQYLGTRLADLYEELENPTPRGWLDKWLERKSRARHIMLATLGGVIIAIALGMTSLAVEGYQAWVSYQQWQHPISSSSS